MKIGIPNFRTFNDCTDAIGSICGLKGPNIIGRTT